MFLPKPNFQERERETFTFHACFPDSVGVFEAWDNVIVDLESEIQAVTATFFQSKPQPFGIARLGDRKKDIRSTGGFDC